MKNWFFFIPLSYTFKTRLNSRKKIIAWFFSYLIPVFICTLYTFQKNSYIQISYLYVISVLMIYIAYEIGYIYNDAEVIKKEKAPTLRLTVTQISFYDSYKLWIYGFRLLLIITITLLLSYINVKFALSIILTSMLILGIFIIYNSLRNNWNIPLYSALVFIRYFGVFILFSSLENIIFLWFIYPLCVTIEFMSKPRFSFPLRFVYEKIDLFRAVYYIVLVVIIFVFEFKMMLISDLVLTLSLYFMFFRLVSYIVFSKKYREEI